MALKANTAMNPKLPRFKNRKEEADYWETHSPMDYSEFKEVDELKFVRPLNHVLAIRLDATASDALAEVGRSKGLGSSTLARMWLLERLEQERGRKSRATRARRESASA